MVTMYAIAYGSFIVNTDVTSHRAGKAGHAKARHQARMSVYVERMKGRGETEGGRDGGREGAYRWMLRG